MPKIYFGLFYIEKKSYKFKKIKNKDFKIFIYFLKAM